MEETSEPRPANSPLPPRPVGASPKDQRLSVSIAAGLIAAIIGAVIWAALTVAMKYQIGFMAIGVGFLVGFAVRLGRGVDKIFGIVGAIFALLGCALGNLLSMVVFFANEQQLSIFGALGSVDYSVLVNAMFSNIQPMDFVFYGIAVYEGYRFSFRPATRTI